LDGNLVMIARTGTTMEVAEGDVRTISSLSMLTNHGDDDGRPRGMNDLGQIAFFAAFTNASTGIFLSDAVAHLPGDYNGDGTVDSGDYIVWRKALPAQNLIADGDRNGVVDEADYELLKEFFGMSLSAGGGSGATANIPEPHGALLLTIAGALVMGRRRRRLNLSR
jgi:MYXO-CTERM domain-containing protein